MRSVAAAGLALAASLAACDGREHSTQPVVPLPAGVSALADAKLVETEHFRILSTATNEQTRDVSVAVEALFAAYVETLAAAAPAGKFQLVLYRDQAQFKANNRSSPWAEAYYRRPRSHAYASNDESSHHWMLHEDREATFAQ